MSWCILKGGVEEEPRPDERTESAGSPLPAMAPRAGPRRRSYAVRHWRGELSLPVSFWVNFFLLSTLYVQFKKYAWPVSLSEFPRPYLTFIASVWLFDAVLVTWQLVGVWRSAGDSLQQGKPKRWGNLARVLMVASLFSFARMFVLVGVPQMVEYSQIARGKDPVGRYTLRLLNNATELELTGAFAFGLGNEVSRILEEHPAIRIIHLESPGGRISEARKVRQLIDSKQMTTYTARRCHSACMLTYVAGRERLIAKGASLGFHQYSYGYPIRNEREYALKPEYDFNLEYEKDKRDWLSRGFSPDFVERAFSTSNSEMWEPSHSELFQAGIVTGYPDEDKEPIDLVTLENFAWGSSKGGRLGALRTSMRSRAAGKAERSRWLDESLEEVTSGPILSMMDR